MSRALRALTLVAGIVTLGPMMLAAGAVAALSIVSEWFSLPFLKTWFYPLDRYAGCAIGAAIAVGCYHGLRVLVDAWSDRTGGHPSSGRPAAWMLMWVPIGLVLASYALIGSGVVRPRLNLVADRTHVAPEESAVEKPIALSNDEAQALARFSSRGFSQQYTAADLDSLKAIWAAGERRTGKGLSQKAGPTYAGALRDLYEYHRELQNCLLTSFDYRTPVTTPGLRTLRKRVLDRNVVSREKVSSDSSSIHTAASRTTRNGHTGLEMPLPREGMVLMRHRIEQLGRNVDFLDSAFAVTPSR